MSSLQHYSIKIVALALFTFAPLFAMAVRMSAQAPMMFDENSNCVPATLSHTYLSAFEAQASYEKLAKEHEAKGRNGDSIRNGLNNRFQLNARDFAIFVEAAMRFHEKNAEIKTKERQLHVDELAKHPDTPVFSDEGRTKLHRLILDREEAARNEMDNVHEALAPSVDKKLDEAVYFLFTSSPCSSRREQKPASTVVK